MARACPKCKEVSTDNAWSNNGGKCPKCESQRVPIPPASRPGGDANKKSPTQPKAPGDKK